MSKHIDLSALEVVDLEAKLRWYEARGSKHAAQIEAIRIELENRAEDEHEEKVGSIVSGPYKRLYRERNAGKSKAMLRGCGDWLHELLAERTLDGDSKLIVAEFEAILEANGIDHAKWNRTTPGWQGRLRMTGRLVLQRVVAEAEALVLPCGTEVAPPRAWVARVVK